jgi:very-short-patch-repair endonuclease
LAYERSELATLGWGQTLEILKMPTVHPNHIIRAKELRAEASKAERLFWWKIKDNKLGFQFRRQYSIPPYFADFVCLEKMLIVELDGQQHLKDKDLGYDSRRTDFLKSAGWTLIRIPNYAIYKHLNNITEILAMYLRDEITKDVFVEKYGQISG